MVRSKCKFDMQIRLEGYCMDGRGNKHFSTFLSLGGGCGDNKLAVKRDQYLERCLVNLSSKVHYSGNWTIGQLVKC